MNYIHRLEDTKNLYAAELVGLKSGLTDLKAYLLSSKFHEDTTVQVRDVLHRISEIENLTSQLVTDQENINHHRREKK